MFSSNFFHKLKELDTFSVEGSREHFIVKSKSCPDSYSESYLLESGAILAFNHIRSKTFPTLPQAPEDFPPELLICNVCLRGRCEIFLPDNIFITISKKRLVFSSTFPQKDMYFPDSFYDGISFYINPKLINTSPGSFLDTSQIDFKAFGKFQVDEHPYCQFTSSRIDIFANYLWTDHSSKALGQIRLLCASLIHEFLLLPPESSTSLALNYSQVRSVEACQQLLCKDLSVRYTVKDLAKFSNISESTLKSRFKLVYGLTITAYMLKKRMEYARDLILHTGLSIGEISQMCGYENHSRFSSAFKQHYNSTPIEFRHSKGGL